MIKDMRNFEMLELSPVDGRRSFYGKAKIMKYENKMFLLSYETIVACVDKNGKFVRLWGGYSQTTMRHVNSFLKYCGINGGGKKWWDKQEVVRV